LTRRLVIWALALLVPTVVAGGVPPTTVAVPSTPALRIETAMHTATISRIAVDAAGRFAATGSWDKTVRVWDLRSGHLVRTIRLPAGNGNEGQVYALAMTPDGKTIAAGGWTGWDWDGTASLYLFDRESGHLVRRIAGLAGRPIRLAYSSDGRWLAAGLRGSNGVKIFDGSGQVAAEDREYDGDCGGLAFSAGGKLVTSSRDGFLRLYAPPRNGKPLQLLAKRRSDSGLVPFGVAFSPDARQVAAGFEDSPAVAVLSGDDLSQVRRADTLSVRRGNLASVAWSADGTQLYAAGLGVDDQAMRFVRIWSQGGAGPWRDVPVAGDTIMDLAAVAGGGCVFAAGDPSWGRISAQGEPQFIVRSKIADFRGQRDRLLVSPDGMTVEFAFRAGGDAARFSILNRELSLHPARLTGLGPRTSAQETQLTQWENSTEASLNGQRLPLERDDETVRSVAVTPDGESVAVGTDWNLYLFNRNGARRWAVPAPDVAWAVNVASEASLVIAAFADGTIRWYSLHDGGELFTLFPNPEGKWVLWTSAGYYDCSPGAEYLIGWSMNRGRDNTPDYFPLATFRAQFYRPDVLSDIAAGKDRAVAIRSEGGSPAVSDVARLLPPVAEITFPHDKTNIASRELAVFFLVRSPSGEPVTSVRALVDGRPVPTVRPVTEPARDCTAESCKGELTISLPAQDAEVAIVAANRFSIGISEPRQLLWSGPKPSEERKPVLYVLAVGVGRYAGGAQNLDFPSLDARDFAAVLARQEGRLYSRVETKTLRDREATRESILQAFTWLRDRHPGPADSVVLFLAGHGDASGGLYYFLPHDAEARNLPSTAIAGSEIEQLIAELPSRAMLFLDTCDSGALFGKDLRGGLTGQINSLSSPEHGIVVFAASTGNQQSKEDPAWENGAFTKALVEGLGGRAGLGPEITVSALEAYLSRRVVQLTAGLQTPTTAKPYTVRDFVIALRNP
jgi:WD40 repeat protein